MPLPVLAPFVVAPAVAAPDVAALDRVLSAAADRGELAAAVRVVDGDDVLLDATYGPTPQRPVCRVGSVTKSFTAATVYALADEGRLSLDDRIGEVLPEVGQQIGPGPTLRQLATHRGGLSEPGANPWLPPPSWEEQAGLMLPQLVVEVPPGERHRYSNFGYTLLAAAAARAGGEGFEAVLRRTLLDPLGLDDTGIAHRPERDVRLLRGRVASPLGLVDVQSALPRLIVYDHRWPVGGAGALTSSPADLVAWAEGLRDGAVLSAAARAELIRPEADGTYAAGWVVDGQRVWHNGALEPLGIYAYLRWSPADRVVVAFCSTPGVDSTHPEWRSVIEAALAGEQPAPPTVTRGALGLVAALSSVGAHWGVGVLGLVVAGLGGGTRRRGRLGAGLAGAGLALLGFGLTHLVLGAAAACLAAGLVARRVRGLPPDARQWPVLLGGWGLVCAVGASLLLGGFSLLVEHVWWLGAQGG